MASAQTSEWSNSRQLSRQSLCVQKMVPLCWLNPSKGFSWMAEWKNEELGVTLRFLASASGRLTLSSTKMEGLWVKQLWGEPRKSVLNPLHLRSQVSIHVEMPSRHLNTRVWSWERCRLKADIWESAAHKWYLKSGDWMTPPREWLRERREGSRMQLWVPPI